MKDTVITAKAKRRELWVVLGCFAAACLINVAAIVRYRTDWSEIFSQLGYVVCIAAVLYLLRIRRDVRMLRQSGSVRP